MRTPKHNRARVADHHRIVRRDLPPDTRARLDVWLADVGFTIPDFVQTIDLPRGGGAIITMDTLMGPEEQWVPTRPDL